ncbi:hypothetical protein V7147_09705 [Bacillus sp. JJ1521]|uniref:hypothetical protein n=1 Tax=Bacillus sp. JJ1521 TaxID=3122957 RepID=UPI002FFE05B5
MELAADRGNDLITWTYDPLETVNGNLNLHNLGAVCTSYIENAYGEMSDGMNDRISADCFVVEWADTEKERENRNRDLSKASILISTGIEDGFLTPGEINLEESSDSLLVTVPVIFKN